MLNRAGVACCNAVTCCTGILRKKIKKEKGKEKEGEKERKGKREGKKGKERRDFIHIDEPIVF